MLASEMKRDNGGILDHIKICRPPSGFKGIKDGSNIIKYIQNDISQANI
jgi:hypothetical protein